MTATINALHSPLDQPVGQLPGLFPTELHLLEITHDKAVATLRLQINVHVSKEFLENTKFSEWLLTVGKKVFVPDPGEGITGVSPLNLTWNYGLCV
jgi:hypothetical protein